MRHLTTFTLASATLALSACGQGGDAAYDMAASPAPMVAMEADASISVSASRAKADVMPPSPEPSANGTIDADTRMLAYDYDASLQVPAGKVGGLLAQHEAACVVAGSKTCQVISSNISESGPEYVYGFLEIRAAREWLDGFRENLPADADKADGRLTSLSARSEDLTRAITDTSARLDAQRTLRDRLIALLARDTDDVGDLLQIERELARVQGDIESAESYLRVLQARVSMDRMTLNYQTLPRAVTPQTARPLIEAFTAFFGVLSSSLAALILIIARALPWLVIGLPLLWILLRWANSFRKKKA